MGAMSCGVSMATWQNLRIQISSLPGDFAWSFLDSLHSPGSSVHRASKIFELGCAVPIDRGE